jgi:hypothetical protein
MNVKQAEERLAAAQNVAQADHDAALFDALVGPRRNLVAAKDAFHIARDARSAAFTEAEMNVKQAEKRLTAAQDDHRLAKEAREDRLARMKDNHRLAEQSLKTEIESLVSRRDAAELTQKGINEKIEQIRLSNTAVVP